VIIPFLFFIFLLTGCQNSSISTNELVLTADNNRIKVQFDKIEEAEWEGKTGFFIHILATSLVEEYSAKDDFLYTLDSTIMDQNNQIHQALFSETLELDSNSVLIKQFYTSVLNDSIESMHINVYVKPNYYERKVVFQNLENQMNNLLMNDLFIEAIQVEDKVINLSIFDVHDLTGLSVSLHQENEDIYPAFTRTNYDEKINHLTASYEFTKALPDTFTLTFNRLKLQDKIWEFPLTIPAN
jgi:hypothetical protein